MEVGTLGLAALLNEQSLITLYGRIVNGMSSDAPEPSKWPSDGQPKFAGISGCRLGDDVCVKFSPTLMLVPGDGEVLAKEECSFHPPTRKWCVAHDLRTIAMAPQGITVWEAVQQFSAARGVSGGIQFSNVHFQGNDLCFDIHYWGRIDLDALFVHVHEQFDKTERNVCIPLINTWLTLFSFDVGVAKLSLEVTYRPHQICARIHLSVPYGLYDGYVPNEGGQCVPVPFRENAPVADGTCCCGKTD
jgi:hypothetical protein